MMASRWVEPQERIEIHAQNALQHDRRKRAEGTGSDAFGNRLGPDLLILAMKPGHHRMALTGQRTNLAETDRHLIEMSTDYLHKMTAKVPKASCGIWDVSTNGAAGLHQIANVANGDIVE